MATVKSGYLQKLSGLLKRDWKKRYFVLYQDGELVYYEQPGNQICDGRVNVRQTCQRIDYANEVERDVQQKAFGRVNCLFTIRSSVKNITVLADNEQDARDWVQKLKAVQQSGMAMTPGVYQPPNAYPGYPTGMPYSQPGAPYTTNQPAMGYPPAHYPPAGAPYPGHRGMPQPGMPQPGMPQPGMPQPGMPQPGIPQPGMPQPYPVASPYPNQPSPYTQPMGTQPPPMYGQYPGYQTQMAPGYQQQQYSQAPQSRSRGGLSSRKGLLAGAAGGAVAGGLLGFGMGHAVGSFGDSFDGDCCDFDCD